MHEHNAHTESNSYCSLFLSVLRCFTSRGSLHTGVTPWVPVQAGGFPHSDISGSQATNRLPGAFRRLVTSFIAILSQGIHRALLIVSHAETYIPQSLFCTLITPRLSPRGFQLPLLVHPPAHWWVNNIRMSKSTCTLFETKTAPSGRFALQTRGLAAYPRLVKVCDFVYT